MFGLIGERLRRYLSGASMAADSDIAAATKGPPEPLKANGSTGTSGNGHGDKDPESENEVSSDSVLPAAGQVKVKESLKEAPGAAKPRGDSQIAS